MRRKRKKLFLRQSRELPGVGGLGSNGIGFAPFGWRDLAGGGGVLLVVEMRQILED